MNKLFSLIAPVAIVLVASLGSAAAHAASPQNDTSAVIITQMQSAQPAEASHGLTRREVYNQLVQAQKDGSLARLNATLFASS